MAGAGEGCVVLEGEGLCLCFWYVYAVLGPVVAWVWERGFMVLVGGLCCTGLSSLCGEFDIVGVRDVGGGGCSMGCDVGRVGAGLGVGRCVGPVWRVL